MPFYIRKSVSVGPFRFNLSKSGIGVSTGIRGLRVGSGPRGHYIHAGVGGLYYRSSIPRGAKRTRYTPSPPGPRDPTMPPVYCEQNIEMLRVSSVDVVQMEDARFSDILDDLTAKQNSISMTAVLGITGAVIALFATFAAGTGGFVGGAIFAGVMSLAGAWRDSVHRSSVLMYHLEDDARAAYERVTATFDQLAACTGKWHIDAGGAVQDIHTWKRNAGASHVVDKRPTEFNYSLPRVIKSNITPPAIKSGKETLYFLPDFLLVVESTKVGAVGYDRLSIRWERSNFIEDGTVPTDTQVLDYVWKHPNKKGGPDLRFSNNYQIPVCLYESIHFTSANGLNELLQVSRAGLTESFADAIGHLARVNGSAAISPNIPRLA